jgi:dsRNA-specific ribonuclease
MKEREITALETVLGYHFHRRAMIEQALTHSSQARELEAQQAGESKYKVNDNEQLEFLGRGEEKSGGRGKTALLVDALEAILAAIYLDGGMAPAREFILREILAPELERMEREGGTLPMTDFKSALQEALQSLGIAQPSYVLVEEAGPEHSKTFTVEVRLNTKNGDGRTEFVGRAQGSTKKTAEQDAARQLLAYLASRPQSTGARLGRESRSSEK